MKSKVLFAASIGNAIGVILFILNYVIGPRRFYSFYSLLISPQFPEWLQLILFGFLLFHPVLIVISVSAFILSLVAVIKIHKNGPTYGSMKLAILNLTISFILFVYPHLLWFIIAIFF